MAVTSTNSDSTVARRQLARELKKLRAESGVSAEDASAELGISLSTMSRIENGKTSVRPVDAKAMCTLYGRPELADALATLAKASKTRSWFRQYSDVIPEWFDVYIGLEQAAASFRWYEAELVPGILQTGDYARTVIHTDHPTDAEAEIERRVQLRLERQSLLARKADSARWHIILSEAILHRPIGGKTVMLDQLNRLLDVADLPNVTLGVAPFTAGMHAGITSGPFVLLDFPTNGGNGSTTEPTTVYVEGFTGALYTDEATEVDRYRTAFNGIHHAALNPTDTKTAIAQAIKEMKAK